MADRLAHAPDLALAALVDRELEHVGPQLAHLGGRRAAVVELDAVAQRAQRAVGDRAPPTRATVGLGHLVARVREAVGELAVVGQQDQAGRVGVEAADRVEARPGARTRSTTVGRPWVSLAVETTPAGLLTA